MQIIEQRQSVLSSNESVRNKYARDTGVDPSMYKESQGVTFITLPQELFMETDDILEEEQERKNSVLAGNLSDWWDKV